MASIAARGENIVFPDDSGVIQMQRDFDVRPNDPGQAAHNTERIRRALLKHRGRTTPRQSDHNGAILYFPNGVYYVSATISLGGEKDSMQLGEKEAADVTFQGQSRQGTIIRLVDASPGFDDPKKPKDVIQYLNRGSSNLAMNNFVRNLTIDIGARNPGAVALAFHNNNWGAIREVTLRTSDPQLAGAIGPIQIGSAITVNGPHGGNLRRLIFNAALKPIAPLIDSPEGFSAITIEDGAADAVVIDKGWMSRAIEDGKVRRWRWLRNNSTKAVVLRDGEWGRWGAAYSNIRGAGPLFIESFCTRAPLDRKFNRNIDMIPFLIEGEQVYARSFNAEYGSNVAQCANDGGLLWVFGYKMGEFAQGHHFLTRGGGVSEILGGLDNGPGPDEGPNDAIHLNDNSHVCHISVERAEGRMLKQLLIREVRGAEQRDFRHGDMPLFSGAHYTDSSTIPLYIGYDPAVVEQWKQRLKPR